MNDQARLALLPKSTWLTPVQTGRYLNIAISTLAKWRCQGGGPTFHKVGRLVRYRISDLDDFVEIRRHKNTSERGY